MDFSSKTKPAKILFFVNGPAPSPEDFEEAAKLRAQVVFRNARMVPSEGALEDCDGVAGAVPNRYAEAFPDAETAIAARAEALAKLARKVGDEAPPPKPATAPAAPKGQAKAAQAAAPAAPAAVTAPQAAPAWTPNKAS